jgi:hypothetical protein
MIRSSVVDDIGKARIASEIRLSAEFIFTRDRGRD